MIYILYYTETGNTEQAALKLGEKLEGAVVANIKTFSSNVLKDEDRLILGCAAYGDEELSEDMKMFIKKLDYNWSGKKLGLFGTYGGGNGRWMDEWVEEMKGLKAVVMGNGLRVHRDSIDKASYDEYADFF